MAFETNEGVLDEALTIALEFKINLPDFPSWGTFAEALGKIGKIASFAAIAVVLTVLVVGTLPEDIVSTVVAAVAAVFKTIVTG